MEKEEILEQIQHLKKEFGDWSYDIPLPFGIWTKGNLKIPHTRLKKMVQIVSDLVDKPLSECRVLDLGCLDGQFSIEFAQQGAETVGIEVRESNIKKAVFCKEVLELKNLSFIQEDARNISIESHGKFDAIICSGLLYHLTASDAIDLISKMFEMSRKVVVIDTHIAVAPKTRYVHDNDEYWGSIYHEHDKQDSQKEKSKRLWASWDNNDSFWFTKPSLINALNKTGFSSVYECITPLHLNYGKLGMEHTDRCTFVAVKSEKRELKTSPTANKLNENCPENFFDYKPKATNPTQTFSGRVFSKLKRILK